MCVYLRTKEGVLRQLIGVDLLNKYPLESEIPITNWQEEKRINLSEALSSAFVKCKCKASCQSRRCFCFRGGNHCGIDCHPNSHNCRNK